MACMASTSTHPAATHEAVLLDDEFVRATRSRLAARMQTARSVADEHLNRIADAHVTVASVVESATAVDNTIAQSFAALRRLIDQREDAFHKQLAAHVAREQRALEALATVDGDRWRVITSTLAMTQRLASDKLGASAPPVLAQLEPAATARLDSLVAQAPTTPVPFPTPVRFEITTDVAQAIESAGKLVIGD